MSDPPPKPARRRVKRSKPAESDISSSIDRSSAAAAETKPVGRSLSPVRNAVDSSTGESKMTEGASGSAEEKISGNTVRIDEGAKEIDGTAAAAGGSASPTKTPVKPGKPPKKELALDIKKRDQGDSAEAKEELINRSVGKPIPTGFLGLLNTYLFSSTGSGYRMESQLRMQGQLPMPYKMKENNNQDKVEWSLCTHIESMLADTTGLVKPAIKIHAVYKDSGMYVKSLKRVPAAPVSTSHVNLDQHSAARPSWDEDLMLGADFKDVVSDDTLLLFELLDDRPSLATSGNVNYRQLKRIAWGYLLPIGNRGQLNVGICKEWGLNNKSNSAGGGRRGGNDDNVDFGEIIVKNVKLQLYSNIDDDGIVGVLQRRSMAWPLPSFQSPNERSKDDTYPDGIPSVYMQWRMQTHNPIPRAHLSMSLFPRQADSSVLPTASAVPAVHAAVVSPGKRATLDPSAEKEIKAFNKAKSFAIKRLRGPKEPCVVPDKLLRRLDVGIEGAMVVQFSSSGHLLAIAAKERTMPLPFAGTMSSQTLLGEVYNIQLFDVDSGDLIWKQTTAHHGVIYSIEWSKDDNYFLSASGDGTVKAWDATGLKDRHDEDDDMPFLLYTMTTSPPVFVYTAIFQEYAKSYVSKNPFAGEGEEGPSNNVRTLPRVIAAGSDGRMRVWDEGEFKGYISVEEADTANNASAPFAHSDAGIHSLTIDQRSRYLLSGDNYGNVFVWRTDSKGWYQLLRRFRRDTSALDSNSPNSPNSPLMQSGGVQSLSMHPDKSKSQVLVLSQCPSSLKVYSTSTYKPVTVCNGMGAGQMAAKNKVSKSNKVNTSGAVFGRATLSPDGRYAIAGVSALSSCTAEGHYNLRVWEAQEGSIYPAILSEINLPYPVRSISWHPEQHVLAIAMVGPGAAVAIYSGERESAELTVGRTAVQSFHDAMHAKDSASDMASVKE